VTERELALRRRIFEAFAATGAPPTVADGPQLRGLAEQHVVVLDGSQVRMAHPFAGHQEGARVQAGDRTWWGNCAWDGLGIVAALGLSDADVHSNGETLRVRDGAVADDGIVFHVAVPARAWWADIGFT
jgi:hypothetical protein